MKRELWWVPLVLIALAFSMVFVAPGLSAEEEVRERKVAVKPGELPSHIKRAIREAFPEGQIIAIEKEVEGEDPGQYDVEIRSGGKAYDVEVSPEGRIIETKEKKAAATLPSSEAGKKWTDTFDVDGCTFSTIGRNRFFSLEPGYQLVLESAEEKVVITVLDETRKIGKVQTRVVEEREEEDGRLKEVSRNFFAICKKHGDVFYFGEEVDDYEDGKVVGHGGAWRADEKDAKAGIMMPGTVLLGARHYQEIAPNAMDRAEVLRDDVTMETPAGTFRNCILVEETSGIDPEEKCYKTYAPGVGLIQDEDLLLTAYRQPEEQPVSLKNLPRAVRATIKKRAGGGEIREIEKKIADGRVVYEVEIFANGKETDILVSAKGKYLGTDQDSDENDKDAADTADEDEDADD
jgi:uncharacterized membrane protein YkoI